MRSPGVSAKEIAVVPSVTIEDRLQFPAGIPGDLRVRITKERIDAIIGQHVDITMDGFGSIRQAFRMVDLRVIEECATVSGKQVAVSLQQRGRLSASCRAERRLCQA